MLTTGAFSVRNDDARREKALKEMGLKIIRFRNDEILKELSMVMGKIKELVTI